MMEQLEQNQQSTPYTEFFSWGSDSDGQLALANSDDESVQYYKQSQFHESPKSLSFDIIISQISCGDYHCAFISGEGFVFSVGKNMDGQLGVGDPALTHSSAPLLIDSLPKVGANVPIQIACGGSHCATLYSNGEMFVWGQGMNGALGINTQANLFAPQQVQGKWAFVTCGKRHSIAVDVGGDAWVTGDNQFRQLGLAHSEKVFDMKRLGDLPFKVKSAAAGIDHSLLLSEDSQIFACGSNLDGNLGLGHNYSCDSFLQVHGISNVQIKEVAAGRHSAAITNDGRLYVWGPVFKGDKPLLIPQELRSNKLMLKVSVGEKTSAVIDEDSHVYSWGISNSQGQLGRCTDPQFEYGNQDENQKMPQIVDALACKSVTQVEVGLDFVVALGQDYDENGNPLQLEIPQMPIRGPPEDESIKGGQREIMNWGHTDEPYKTTSYSPYSTSNRSYLQKEQSSIQMEHSNLMQGAHTANKQPAQKPPLIQPPQSYEKETYKQTYTPSQPIQVSQGYTSQYTHTQGSNKKVQESQRVNSSYLSNNSDMNKEVPQSASIQRSYHKQELSHERERPASQSNINLGFTSNNSEFYKQLDTLREENFQAKQKNRELQHQVNTLKDENEQIMKNADEEIKRMSEFIDKYTAELDLTKKQAEEESQQMLEKERKTYEQKERVLQERVDQLTKELEASKVENQQIHHERQEWVSKEKRYLEQLQLSHQQNQLKERQQLECFSTGKEATRARFQDFGECDNRNMSPLVVSKTPEQFSYQTNEPSNFASRSPINGPQSSSYYQPFNSRQQTQYRQYSNKDAGQPQKDKSFERPFSQEQLQHSQISSYQDGLGQGGQIVNMRQKELYPRQENPREVTSNQSRYPLSAGGASPMYLSRKEGAGGKREGEAPQFGITSPDKQEYNDGSAWRYQQYQQKTVVEDYRNTTESSSVHKPRNEEQRYNMYIQDENYYNEKSPISDLKRHRAPQSYTPVPQSLEAPAKESGSTLNDVKNRLALMQRNKEELEEKLKAYEAKIKQHFNR